MNQILYTIQDENSKKNLKKILLFFVIVIIIFGIILTGMGGYQLVSSIKRRNEAIEMAKIPVIGISMENNQAIIKVEHTKNIKSIIYRWNKGEETTLSENKSGTITEKIDVLAGTNILDVVAVDIEGKTATASKEISYNGTYMNLSVVNNKQIKITVTDIEGLQSLSYKWNSEEEKLEYPQSRSQQTMEIISDIPIGLNTISVTAINNKNITQTKEMSVQGITKPTVKVNFKTDRTVFIVKMNDEQGLKSYSYKLYNAKVDDVAKDGKLIENVKEKLTLIKSDEKTLNGELSITDNSIELTEGFNYLELTVKNIEGAEETISGWCVR